MSVFITEITDPQNSNDARGYVELSGATFTPSHLEIELGETVEWVWINGTHNVNGSQDTFPLNPESFLSGEPGSGLTFSFTFNIAGTYDYQCNPHANSGMAGSLTVGTGGCMDSGANNYGSTADYDDGSCQYDSVYGCTNTLACNYDPNATDDDDSCSILGHLNEDSEVTIIDVILLVDFILESNNTTDCAADLNQDGDINILDIISLINIIVEGAGDEIDVDIF